MEKEGRRGGGGREQKGEKDWSWEEVRCGFSSERGAERQICSEEVTQGGKGREEGWRRNRAMEGRGEGEELRGGEVWWRLRTEEAEEYRGREEEEGRGGEREEKRERSLEGLRWGEQEDKRTGKAKEWCNLFFCNQILQT